MTHTTNRNDESAGKAAPKAVSKQTDKRLWLIGLEPEELQAALAEMGLPAFRVKQIWHWLYHRGATDFSQMTSLSRKVQADLAARFRIDRPAVTTAQLSSDGTRKWLVRFQDSREVESVFIPEEDRGALCVSSQVGCTLSCSFCHTGTQKLVRNLSAGEIVSQVLIAHNSLNK